MRRSKRQRSLLSSGTTIEGGSTVKAVPGGCYANVTIKPKRQFKGVLFDVGEVFPGTTVHELLEDHLRRCRSGEISPWRMTEDKKANQYYKTSKKRRYPSLKRESFDIQSGFDQGRLETLLTKKNKSATVKPLVIIVGAGFAGLAAARALQFYGFQVKVLEARKRVGGRCNTLFEDGTAIELGAREVQGLYRNSVAELCTAKKMVFRGGLKSELTPIFDNFGEIFTSKAAFLKTVNVRRELDNLGCYLERTAFLERICKEYFDKGIECGTNFLMLHNSYPKNLKLVSSETNLDLQNQLRLLDRSNMRKSENLVPVITNTLGLKYEEVDDVLILLEAMRDAISFFGNGNPAPVFKWKCLGETIASYLELEVPHMDSQQKRVFNRYIYDQLARNAGNLDKSSLQCVSLEYENEDDGQQHYVIQDGHSTLAAKLKNDIEVYGGEIVLETKVRTINYESSETYNFNKRVAVIDTNGEQHSAEFCIITVPLGLLKSESLEFVPRLPEKKLLAIDEIGFATVNKVVLIFSKIMWKQEFTDVAFVDENSSFTFTDLSKSTQKPIILVTIRGPLAEEIEVRDDEQVEALCTQALIKIHPSLRGKKPVRRFITRWRADKDSCGAMSHMKTGISLKSMDTLSEEVKDVLFFAGEATISSHHGSTHGAIISGRREACKIAKVQAHRHSLLQSEQQ